MKTLYLADWLLPVSSEPLRDGALLVENGTILAIGSRAELFPLYASHAEVVSLGAAVMAPGWVNTHCHLELSALHNQIPCFDHFPDWITRLIELRSQFSDNELRQAARQTAKELARSGCVLVGDITNGLFLEDDKTDSLIERVVFYELLGFNPALAQDIVKEASARVEAENPAALCTPHAPYSTSARLMQLLHEHNRLQSVHLAESPEEVSFLRDGSGPFRSFLKARNIETDAWNAPGASPVAYLDSLGVLDAKTLLVHGVQVEEDDLSRIHVRQASVSICARSNAHMNVGQPPLKEYLKKGIRVSIGTDSLASNDDLDMNNEINYLFNNFSGILPAELIKLATLNGAVALQKEEDYGSLEAGKRARFNVFFSDKPVVRNPEAFIVSKSWSHMKCF